MMQHEYNIMKRKSFESCSKITKNLRRNHKSCSNTKVLAGFTALLKLEKIDNCLCSLALSTSEISARWRPSPELLCFFCFVVLSFVFLCSLLPFRGSAMPQ